MERTIYLHTCLECGFDWESTLKEEDGCPMCHCGDIHSVEVDDENEVLSLGKSN